MKISRISALIAAAILTVSPLTGCFTTKPTAPDTGLTSTSGNNGYAENSEIGKETIEISVNEDTSHNDSSFKVNRVIDSGKRTDDGLKYIYIDVTIKNNMSTAYTVNALNNFYLLLSDETEVFSDIRTDIYAKQSINGYEQLLEIPAHEEYNGYIGFLLDPYETSFTVCYFATANSNDKETVIRCPINASDIITAPEGFLK